MPDINQHDNVSLVLQNIVISVHSIMFRVHMYIGMAKTKNFALRRLSSVRWLLICCEIADFKPKGNTIQKGKSQHRNERSAARLV